MKEYIVTYVVSSEQCENIKAVNRESAVMIAEAIAGQTGRKVKSIEETLDPNKFFCNIFTNKARRFMSKAIRCDCCKRTSPDINPRYSSKRKWSWFRYDFDSNGGSYAEMDLCEDCWKEIGNNVREGGDK